MFLLRNKLYLLLSVTIVNTLLLTYCICTDISGKNDNQQKISVQKQQTLKATRSTNGDASNISQKQGVATRGKAKSYVGRKHKKFNETELIQKLSLQLSHDLSLQLPELNVGGYLQSALGGAGGPTSKVLLKIHKTPEPKKVTPKAKSVLNQENVSHKQEPFRGIRHTRSSESTEGSTRSLKRQKRDTPCKQGDELDEFTDELFRFGTRIVKSFEPVTLPNATIDLVDYNIQIFLYQGKGTRVYKFRRTKPAWVYCSNETISLGLTVEVEELKVAYKYRVINGDRLIFDGDLEARLSPKLQIQFSQKIQSEDSEEPVMQRVDRLRIFRLGRVQVIIRGLGNLTQSLSMLINSYLNDNQEELQPTFRMIEGDAVKMINKMLANVNVPLLSVV